MPHHTGGHGYIELTLVRPAGWEPALNDLRREVLPAGVTVDAFSAMEDPAHRGTQGVGLPGPKVVAFVKLDTAAFPGRSDVAHVLIEGLKAQFEASPAGAYTHFARGLSHHWCCYSDI